VFELGGAGLLAKTGLEEARERQFAVATRGRGRGGVKAIEDEEVAFWIVQGWKGSDALEMVHGAEGVHLVVFNVVPGDVPAGAIGLDADGEIHGAKIVADGGKTCHKGQIGAADGEDERIMGVVGGDDAMDLGGGTGEGVVGSMDVVEGLAGVSNGEDGQDRRNRSYGHAAEGGGGRGSDTSPEGFEDYGDQKGERNRNDQVVTGLQVVVIGKEGCIAERPEEKRWDKRIAEETGTKEKGRNCGEKG
jgi:hypothetical protein